MRAAAWPGWPERQDGRDPCSSYPSQSVRDPGSKHGPAACTPAVGTRSTAEYGGETEEVMAGTAETAQPDVRTRG